MVSRWSPFQFQSNIGMASSMNKLLTLACEPKEAEICSQKLASAIEQDTWVQLLPAKGDSPIIPNSILPKGPGVVISSGGSCGGPHQCLHPSSHLDQSAIATGQWLQNQGLQPKDSVILNPLPLHHVSGLMPWWRSRIWEAQHTWLTPSLMRNPIALRKSCESIFQRKFGPLLISLVPTQIQRLIEHADGLKWLQSFDVIWVGGSRLSKHLADKARRNKIHLAPCYGTTETAAMISVQTPKEFLEGRTGCGQPLIDVELRLTQNGALEVKTPRLASAQWKDGSLKNIKDEKGWWRSGDFAKLTMEGCFSQLEIIGRIDTAIHSGGETIFLEQLEPKLSLAAKKVGLPIQYLIFIPINEDEWGQRLVALVRWKKEFTPNEHQEQLRTLQNLTKTWQPAERPFAWYECKELAPNDAGKWERSKWNNWLKTNH